MSTVLQYEEVQGPGWPRERRPYAGFPENKQKMLPVPWVTGKRKGSPNVEWTSFHQGIGKAAEGPGLCQVCGEELAWVKVFGLMYKEPYYGHYSTSGPGMHPRCAAMAFKFCPHFEAGEDATVAAVYRGTGLGMIGPRKRLSEALSSDEPGLCKSVRPYTRAEAKRLAARNPMGLKGVR